MLSLWRRESTRLLLLLVLLLVVPKATSKSSPTLPRPFKDTEKLWYFSSTTVSHSKVAALSKVEEEWKAVEKNEWSEAAKQKEKIDNLLTAYLYYKKEKMDVRLSCCVTLTC